MGSGTTALAAINLNRHFIGAEKNTKYYKHALKRIKEIGKEVSKQKQIISLKKIILEYQIKDDKVLSMKPPDLLEAK